MGIRISYVDQPEDNSILINFWKMKTMLCVLHHNYCMNQWQTVIMFVIMDPPFVVNHDRLFTNIFYEYQIKSKLLCNNYQT